MRADWEIILNRRERMRVEYATAVYGEEEINAVVEVLRTRWLAPAQKANEFEVKMAELSDKRCGLFVNSGSSANLLAIWAMDISSSNPHSRSHYSSMHLSLNCGTYYSTWVYACFSGCRVGNL